MARPYSWCLQETAVFVSSQFDETKSHRQTTAACVSLSNLQCQRPDRLPPTPLFCAGGRRRRLSSGRPPWCQSLVSEIFAPLSKPGFERKEYRGPPRGFPHKSVAIQLRLGKIPIFARKSSAFRSPVRSSGYCPERRRLLCPAACRVNRQRSAFASMTAAAISGAVNKDGPGSAIAARSRS